MNLSRAFLPIAVAACVAAAVVGCSRPKAGQAGKKFCWVQANKGLGPHQLTQIAFAEGCRKLGYECVVVGSNNDDVGGTIALAEQALAAGDVAGIALWSGTDAYDPLIERAVKAGVPVVLPHFPIPESAGAGASGVISCDPVACATEAAERMGQAIHGHGTVAITQGGYNTTENPVAQTFMKVMHEKFPEVKVLEPVAVKFNASDAATFAKQILKGDPNVVAAFSTTGGGAQTWAVAQRTTGRKLTIIGMDYTRINLDLVKNGEVFGLVAQPMWDESFQAAELLDKLVHKQKIPWWTKLPAPFITRENVEQFYAIPEKVEAALQR